MQVVTAAGESSVIVKSTTIEEEVTEEATADAEEATADGEDSAGGVPPVETLDASALKVDGDVMELSDISEICTKPS